MDPARVPSKRALVALLILLLSFAACGVVEDPPVVVPPPIGSARHLFDLPPAPGAREPKLDPRLVGWFDAAGVWILDERIPPEAWFRDGRVGDHTRWMAPLRHPLEGRRRVTPVERLHLPEVREQVGTGRERIEEAGMAALMRVGLVNVTWPAGKGKPPELPVSYLASTSAVANALPTLVDDGEGGANFAPRTRILGEEARRALAAPPPWSRAWTVDVPDRALLRFAWGHGAHSAEITDIGLRLEPMHDDALVARVVASVADGVADVLWQSDVEKDEAGHYHEVRLDLGAYAGRQVTFRFELGVDADEAAARTMPLALLAEPIIESPPPADAPRPPNVLLVLVDTLRADRLGCYGWERAHTPNFDRLAERGVRFSNVLSAAPWTLPSIASLLSSLYVSEHGIAVTEALPEGALTIAEALRSEAYLTAAFTEGGYAGKAYGLAAGFDVFRTGPREVSSTVERAREWLSTVDSPYFLLVHTYQPHEPYEAPQAWQDLLVRPYVEAPDAQKGRQGPTDPVSDAHRQFLEDSYDAEIAYTDDVFGDLFDWLEAEGKLDDLVIIMTSDHGEEFGEHGHFSHGISLYEEQLRVPLILYGKGRYEGGIVLDHRVHSVDIAPTIARIVGMEVPEPWSGVPLSTSPDAPDRAVYSTFYTRWDREPATTYLLRERKFISYPHDTREHDVHPPNVLFDLDRDPTEQHDLLQGNAEERARWLRAVDHVWRTHPARFTATDAVIDSKENRELEDLGYVGSDQ